MKKIILFTILLFSFLFFSPNSANASTCSELGGECIPASSCSSNNVQGTTTDCSSPGICCLPTSSQTCSSVNGECVPKISCSSNNSQFVTKSCGSSIEGVCCYVSSGSSSSSSLSGRGTCSGLVPCGCTNGPPCTLCYFVVGIQGLINYGFRIMVGVAILMITIGGVMYIVSVGSGMMETAKKVLYNTLIGFAVILGGWLIVNTIIYYIGASDSSGMLKSGNNWGNFTCSTETTETTSSSSSSGSASGSSGVGNVRGCDTKLKKCVAGGSGAICTSDSECGGGSGKGCDVINKKCTAIGSGQSCTSDSDCSGGIVKSCNTFGNCVAGGGGKSCNSNTDCTCTPCPTECCGSNFYNICEKPCPKVQKGVNSCNIYGKCEVIY